MTRRQAAIGIVALAALAALLYLAIRQTRDLTDFEVYRTAGARLLRGEPLYRAEDGHFVFKYLPAFAFGVVPFALVGPEPAKAAWFVVSFALAGRVRRGIDSRIARSPAGARPAGRAHARGHRPSRDSRVVARSDERAARRAARRLIQRDEAWRARPRRHARRDRDVRETVRDSAGAVARGDRGRQRPRGGDRGHRGGTRASSGGVRLERQPRSAGRVVPHRHRNHRAQHAAPREHLDRLGVGQVDRRRAAGGRRWPSATVLGLDRAGGLRAHETRARVAHRRIWSSRCCCS